MSTEEWMVNTEQQINPKFSVQLGKTLSQASANVLRWYHVMFLSGPKRFREDCKEVKDNSMSKMPSTNRTEVNAEWIRGGEWRLTVKCSNNHKSGGYEKEQRIEDYNQRFGYVWKVTGLGVLSIQQFLAKRIITMLKQPPYLSELAPWDIFLFPKLKGIIKESCFGAIEAIKRVVIRELRILPTVHRSMTEKDRKVHSTQQGLL